MCILDTSNLELSTGYSLPIKFCLKWIKKTSTLCDFCQKEEDSNEHMFLHCKIVKQLWREVEDWISHIGVVDYAVTDETIILGELKKSHWLNSIVFSLLDRHDILAKRWGMMLEYFEEQQS